MSGSANFGFLKQHEPVLAELGGDAERFFAQHPDVTIFRLRQLGEFLAQRAAAHAGMLYPEESQNDLLRRLEMRNVMPQDIARYFHRLRRAGNAATHEAQGSHAEALDLYVWQG